MKIEVIAFVRCFSLAVIAAGVGSEDMAAQSSVPEQRSSEERPGVIPVAGGVLLGSGLVLGATTLFWSICEPQNKAAFMNDCDVTASVMSLGIPLGGALGAVWAMDRMGFRSGEGRAVLGAYLSALVGVGVGWLAAEALEPSRDPVCHCVHSDVHEVVGVALGGIVYALGAAYFSRSTAELKGMDAASSPAVSLSLMPRRGGGVLALQVRF